MNTLTTENFKASRQPNGDVWIAHRGMIWTPIKNGYPLPIKIPQEDCAELAKLLMWPVVSESHKVDYTLSVNEPE